MHGGDLRVVSTVDQGSTFSFDLPIVSVQQAAISDGSTGKQNSSLLDDSIEVFNSPVRSLAKTYTMLVIENDVAQREVLQRTMENAGHAVVATHGGEHVFDLAIGLLPMVIVLDVDQ